MVPALFLPAALASASSTMISALPERFATATEDPDELGATGQIPEALRPSPDVIRGAVDPRTLTGAGPPIEVPEGPLGIPEPMLFAYVDGARELADTTPGCGVDWAVLASIGRIESAHARSGDIDVNGTTVSAILGPRLNGGPSIAAIRDTDNAFHDGDPVWDRAVGPMQFIPSTWSRYAVDGNDDLVASPHNVHDSITAAGNYLCAGGTDLRDAGNLAAAVFTYNQSDSYVREVLIWADAYRRGVNPLPTELAPSDERDVLAGERLPEESPDVLAEPQAPPPAPDVDGLPDESLPVPPEDQPPDGDLPSPGKGEPELPGDGSAVPEDGMPGQRPDEHQGGESPAEDAPERPQDPNPGEQNPEPRPPDLGEQNPEWPQDPNPSPPQGGMPEQPQPAPPPPAPEEPGPKPPPPHPAPPKPEPTAPPETAPPETAPTEPEPTEPEPTAPPETAPPETAPPETAPTEPEPTEPEPPKPEPTEPPSETPPAPEPPPEFPPENLATSPTTPPPSEDLDVVACDESAISEGRFTLDQAETFDGPIPANHTPPEEAVPGTWVFIDAQRDPADPNSSDELAQCQVPAE